MMEKTLKWGFPVLIALLGAFLFSACQFDSPSEPDLITYDVTTDGSSTSTSTKIVFAFSGAVEGLSANDITVGPTTVATKGNLSGSGQNWSLGITVQSQETLKVSINKSGIDSAEKTVQVYYRAPDPAKVATPVANPAPGPVGAGTEVGLSTATEGATIHYTTDNSDPTANSTVYSTAFTISTDITIKAIAVKAGMLNSDILTAAYTATAEPAKIATPVANPAAGAVVSGTGISLSTDTEGATIHYTTDGSDPSASSAVYSTPISIEGATTIKAIAVKDGMTASDTMTASYTIAQVATPVASPGAGAVDSGTVISLSSETEGASIYYTLDDSDPTTTSTEYTESSKPSITSALTLKAIAVKTGMVNSGILSAAYTVNSSTPEQPPPPEEPATPGPLVVSSAETGIMEKGGGTRQFSATIDGVNANVTWEVSGKQSSGTSIDTGGLLTVAADETSINLVVTASDQYDFDKTASVTVKRKGWMDLESSKAVFGTDSTSGIQGIAYGNGRWVAIAGSYTTSLKIAYSDDGFTWTAATHSVPVDANWDKVIYAGGKFIATTQARITTSSPIAPKIITSSDGVTWTIAADNLGVGDKQGTSYTYRLGEIAYGNGTFVAMKIEYVGSSSSRTFYNGVVISSDGGVTWTEETVSIMADAKATSYTGITFGNNMFISALGAKGGIAKSSNGTDWELVSDTAGSGITNAGDFTSRLIILNELI
jgi:hypothetical protein